jgi:hypothetical protein
MGLYSLPFHSNRVVDGWQVSTFVTAHSGNPYNITTGIATQTFRDPAARPNLVAGSDPKAGQTAMPLSRAKAWAAFQK